MGFSRVLIAALERAIPRGKIETDTDGVYCERAPPKPLLERAVNRLVKRYGFEPRFTVDIDHYKAAWFNARKSYLLLTHEGKVKRYGQGMKGSTHPALFDDIVMGVGRALLEHGRKEGLRRARVACDLSQYSPRQFVQRTRLSKPIADYPHKTLGVKVALAYQAEYGDEPRVGTSYEYVRTRAGNVPPTPENLARLDEYQYLSKVVVPALGRLGFSPEELGLEDRLKLKSAQAKRPQGETSLSKFL